MATAASAPLKFSPGFVPEEIALTKLTGHPSYSQFNGDQLMYTLTDGRRWFADLYVADKIKELGVQPGEIFEAYKTETRHGNQRIVQVVLKKRAAPELLQRAGAASKAPSTATYHSSQNHSSAALSGNGGTSADHLARCYRDAVDIVLSAVGYAKEQGLHLSPDFSDIRALAATIAINETGGRR